MAATTPATVISRHQTSEGVVQYVRTPSGGLQVQLLPAGDPVELVAASDPSVTEDRVARALTLSA